MQKPQDISGLLVRWADGDAAALEGLMPLVYSQLRAMAQRHVARERRDHSLPATALVHEAFARLVQQRVDWRARGQFFAIASRLMRRILVDRARARLAHKRGAGDRMLALDEGKANFDTRPAELLALDDALESLAKLDPRQARIVELRFFGGMTIDETAQATGVSAATVEREWKSARAFLRREMTAGR